MLAGIGLGVSGAVLQGVSRNPLADPGILGLHRKRFLRFDDVYHILSFPGGAGVDVHPAVYVCGRNTRRPADRSAYVRQAERFLTIRMLLVGIAVSAGFSAVTLFMSLRLNEETYTFASRWLVGNVWGRDWIHVWSLLPWIGILAPLAWLNARSLNILMLGDQAAAGLGAHVQRKGSC